MNPTNTTNEDKGYTLWYNPYNDLFCELSPHGEKFYGESRICVIHWPPARMRRYGWYYIGDL